MEGSSKLAEERDEAEASSKLAEERDEAEASSSGHVEWSCTHDVSMITRSGGP